MTNKALNALHGSIEHWDRLIEGVEDEEPSIQQCPLCRAFRYHAGGDICKSCPVRDATGQTLCHGTPYKRAYAAWYRWMHGGRNKAKWLAAGQEELAFLKGLLPGRERVKRTG